MRGGAAGAGAAGGVRRGGPARAHAAAAHRGGTAAGVPPLTIRTARDAVSAAAHYLTWLGFREVTHPANRPASRIDLRAAGLIAQVDSSTRPTALRDVECLWLNALNGSVRGVLFSLAGYAPEARQRADALFVPLFVMDLTGSPQPVNGAADELFSTGA